MTSDDVRLPAANHKKLYFLPAYHKWARILRTRKGCLDYLDTVSHTMAIAQDACTGCCFTYWQFTSKFFEKSSVAVSFLRQHGVLPKGVECPNCKLPCKLREDRLQWYCGRYCALPKRKRRKQCNFTVLGLLSNPWGRLG